MPNDAERRPPEKHYIRPDPSKSQQELDADMWDWLMELKGIEDPGPNPYRRGTP
ncbi:MAG TPA: hypothetical protein VEI83_09685 [Acidimicrobiales bacterium]|nr:hypothetical protein [Acidimicrobiales bacterium]